MPEHSAVDDARRFGGLARLYGPAAATLRDAHVAVAGIGGVGSWCAEALARSGIGALTLIDLDHLAESNINRQLHALTSTLGQSKTRAMADRIADIHPHCRVASIEEFVEPGNVQALVPADVRVLIDCTDQMVAKVAMILHTAATGQGLVVCGGAGGKTDPLQLRAGDLSRACNDALLSKLRNLLRRAHGYPRASDAQGRALKRIPAMGVHCLWVDQPAILPDAWRSRDEAGAALPEDGNAFNAATEAAPQGLSCAGYGSAVTVTASMGLAAANAALLGLLRAGK